MKKSVLIKRRKNSRSFNPNHETIDQAQQEYFKRGGTITFLNPQTRSVEQLLKQSEKDSFADEFLNEQPVSTDIKGF